MLFINQRQKSRDFSFGTFFPYFLSGFKNPYLFSYRFVLFILLNICFNISRTCFYCYFFLTVKKTWHICFYRIRYCGSRRSRNCWKGCVPPPYTLSLRFDTLYGDTGQNPRRHVVLIEFQPNACNKYILVSDGRGHPKICWVVYFCIFRISFFKLCCVLTLVF
jgi:hypothetical protein